MYLDNATLPIRSPHVTLGGCLLALLACRSASFSVCPLYLKRDPRLKADPLNEGLTCTRRKNAWCSTQHFHKCLHACRDGVSKPYVLSSF